MALFWKCPYCSHRNKEHFKSCKKCRKKRPPNCKWGVDITVDYRRIRRVFDNKEAAVAYEARIKGTKIKERIARDLGIKTPTIEDIEQNKTPTFRTFWAQYYAWCLSTNHQAQWKLTKWKNHLEPFFGFLRLDEIRARDIVSYQSKRLKQGAAPATVNREVAIIRHMLNMAVKWEIIPHNPIAGKVEMLPENEKRQYLTPEEVSRLYKAINKNYRDLLLFLVTTGLRVGEVLNLTWKNVDLEKKIIVVKGYQTKIKKEFAIPLNKTALEILKKRKKNMKDPEEKVFPHSKKWFYTAFKKALKKAGLDQSIRIHDLRHTYASWLVQNDVPIQIVQMLLAHKRIETTLRYAHLAVNTLAKASEKVTKLLSINQ